MMDFTKNHICMNLGKRFPEYSEFPEGFRMEFLFAAADNNVIIEVSKQRAAL